MVLSLLEFVVFEGVKSVLNKHRQHNLIRETNERYDHGKKEDQIVIICR